MSIVYNSFSSAEEALASLGGGKLKVRKRDVTRACRRIAAATGVDFRSFGGPNKDYSLFCTLRIFDKTLKVVQTPTALIFFSDALFEFEEELQRVARTCIQKGVNVEPFVTRFPTMDHSDGYRIPRSYHIRCHGYRQLSRGTLSGFRVFV